MIQLSIDETFEDAINIKPGGQITKIGWFMKKMLTNFDNMMENLKIKSFSHNFKKKNKIIVKKYLYRHDLKKIRNFKLEI